MLVLYPASGIPIFQLLSDIQLQNIFLNLFPEDKFIYWNYGYDMLLVTFGHLKYSEKYHNRKFQKNVLKDQYI